MPSVVGPKVLIVDDEEAISDTLGQIFSSRGYEARVAYSAEQAIDVIAHWQPDLAILDVMLPLMNGIDLAIVLKDNYPSCGCILFSGQSAAAQIAEQAAKKGHVFEILEKPVPPDLLLDTAANLLFVNATVAENTIELELDWSPRVVSSKAAVMHEAAVAESSDLSHDAMQTCLQLAELRLSLCFTFCAIAENELRSGQRLRVESMLQKLRQTAQSVRHHVTQHNLLTEELRAGVDAKLEQLDQRVLDLEKRMAD